jgi:hypothetical protein
MHYPPGHRKVPQRWFRACLHSPIPSKSFSLNSQIPVQTNKLRLQAHLSSQTGSHKGRSTIVLFLGNAIFVSGDYRLMPESNGLDVMEDLSDFWEWIRSGELQRGVNKLKGGVEADLEKVIAYGESAGGTLAVSSGFSHPDVGKSPKILFIEGVLGGLTTIYFQISKTLLTTTAGGQVGPWFWSTLWVGRIKVTSTYSSRVRCG